MNLTANKIQGYVNRLYSISLKIFNDLCNEYDLSKEWNKFVIYHVLDTNDDIEDIRSSKVMNRILTLSKIYSDQNSQYSDTDDAIIEEVEQTIYMSQQAFYEEIIGCLMDSERFTKSMEFLLLHEVGHILYNRTFIGKPAREWYVKNDAVDYSKLPKLRKNASQKNRLEWMLTYMRQPGEAAANNMVGITDQDIINNFNMTHGW